MHHRTGLSKRECARIIHASEHMVRKRLIKMARWSLLFQAMHLAKLKIKEPIVYDGLENFSFSQYDPNNINHAVGKSSLYTYDFNFCPINRKGRMSARQKNRKSDLEKKFGSYPQDSIRYSTTKILKRLLKSSEGILVLHSDRHYQYRESIQIDLKDCALIHLQTCSKIARNFKNPLFAVNNIDMQARHNLAAFKRETIAFSKHSVAMCESFALQMVYRNYMRPKFWGTHRSDPRSNKRSPAMEIGLVQKILSFDDFFREKPRKVMLNEDWALFYNRVDPLSRRPIARVA